MLFSQMVEFVRAQCDADPEDAPEATLERYAAAAYDDVRRRRSSWPHKYAEVELLLTPGEQTYTLASLGGGDFERVASVVYPGLGSLQVKPLDELRSGLLAGDASGTPRFVAVGPQNISFWPTPDDAVSVTITGYKQFSAFPGNGQVPADLPREFDMPICWAMCRDYFMFQEESDMAVLYDRRFENDTSSLVSRLGQNWGSYASPAYFTGNIGRATGRR